jgi:hypothetical protein
MMKTEAAPPTGDTASDKIDRAVAFINERAKAIATEMIAIGRYLLKEFFDDDPREVSRRSPSKMNSVRDLAARKDLLLGYTTLWRSVKLAVQERRFGIVATLQQLTLSHRIALLSIDEDALVRELARLAAKNGWSVAKLREEIERHVGGKRDRGADSKKRPGRGPVALMEMSVKALAGPKMAPAFDPARLAEMKPERIARLRPMWRELRDRCQAALEATRGKGRA